MMCALFALASAALAGMVGYILGKADGRIEAHAERDGIPGWGRGRR